ncbi:MAG: hypothetical protein IJ863_02670 [Spirochaetales bacterium]|nr:hypothetical protein [Spirochaetales bacterium]
MGGIGIGVSGTNMQSYPNPAAIFFDDNDFTFAFRGILGDTAGVASWPYLPETSISGMFVSEMITMGIDVTFAAGNPNLDFDHVDMFQTSTLQVNFCAGYGPVSAGIGVSGGSVRQRLDVVMKDVPDYFMQTMLSKYDRVVNSEYIQVDAGLMLEFRQFHFGMLLDNVLDKDGSSTTFTWRSLFAEAGIGAYWSRSEYSARGRMNNLVYSAGLELTRLFDRGNVGMNVGGEVKFRLVRDSSVSVRAGYSAEFDTFGSGTVTTGLGVAFRNVELALNLQAPIGSDPSLKAYGTLLF